MIKIWKYEEIIMDLKEILDDIYYHIKIINENILLLESKIGYETVYVGYNNDNLYDNNTYTNELSVYSSNNRRRLFFSALEAALKAFLKFLQDAINAIGSFITKLGELLSALGDLIASLVDFILDFLFNAIQILLFAFKAEMRSIVAGDMGVQLAVKMRFIGVPIEFCISISLSDGTSAVSEAADQSVDAHSDEEQKSVDQESAKEVNSKGEVTSVRETPASNELPPPKLDEPMSPRQGLPNLGLDLNKDWCEVYA